MKQNNKLPGNSITTSHIVGILLSQRRRGVIKWPAYGTRRRICLEATQKQKHQQQNYQKQIIFRNKCLYSKGNNCLAQNPIKKNEEIMTLTIYCSKLI